MAPTDLQFAVLTALAEERRHGYALLKRAEELLARSIPVATAYACFESLTRRGWISPDGDDIVDGRVRRNYRITPGGASVLRVRAEELSRSAGAARRSLEALEGGGLA